MIMTAWDGHLRIDRPEEADTVTLTLLTLEPTTEMRLRTGLILGFVTADPHGPPAFVAVALRGGRLPPDVSALLGPRLSDAATDLFTGQGTRRWLRLDLTQVDDLAAAWAPYRRVTLATGQQDNASSGALGTWAEELWTRLGLPSWRDMLRIAPSPGFRGVDRPTGEPRVRQGTWRLPDELADAVAVRPDVEWELRPTNQDTVEISVLARPTGAPRGVVLQAGLDDGSQLWVPFEADAAGDLRVRLTSSDESVNVRFRTEGRSSR